VERVTIERLSGLFLSLRQHRRELPPVEILPP
jgi:hypothetical protein